MNFLIVLAHPDPASFNAALKDAAVETLVAAGHHVQVSDLYRMGFNPVAGPEDVQASAHDPGVFPLGAAQAKALATGTLADDIRAEQEKLAWCHGLILQFPFWWFSVPAILKGWIDRVFSVGFAYDSAGRWYDRGGLAGRRAMLSLTTGGGPTIYAPDGLNGEINRLLWPLQNGVLRFCGFDVLPPFVGYAVARLAPDQRAALVDQFRARLTTWADSDPLFFHPLDDFTDQFRLKPGVRPTTDFQWRP